MKLNIFLGICLSWVLSACGSDYYYASDHALPGGVWAFRDTVDFKFEIADTSARYNLYVDFVHADSFPFQNLYLRLKTQFPDGRRTSDVKSFDLYNGKGESNGKCSGSQCTVQLNLKQNTRFPQPGAYTITFEQYTRRDSVPGVAKIGMAIEKIKKP